MMSSKTTKVQRFRICGLSTFQKAMPTDFKADFGSALRFGLVIGAFVLRVFSQKSA